MDVRVFLLCCMTWLCSLSHAQSKGKTSTYNVVKGDNRSFYYSDEMGSITIYDTLQYRLFFHDVQASEHNPVEWETSEIMLNKIMAMPDNKPFAITIQLVPSVYSHTNKRGAKCKHDYMWPHAKIIAVKPL
jgi:hypothetical protein